MRLFAARAAIALSFLAAVAVAPAPAAGQGITFTEGRPFAESLKRARAEKKPLMVDTYAVWCGPCKQLDRMTFADPSVGAWARANVIPVKIDAEKGEGRRISQRYSVRAFPTVLFLDPSGNEIDRLSGAYPPADFMKVADGILARKSPLNEALASLAKKWDPALAGQVADQLVQRNDLPRLRPLAWRATEEDPGLAEEGSRQAFLYLVSLEDGAEKLSPETLDLVESVAPRLEADPRVAVLRLAASREQARRGDAAAARASAQAGLKASPDDSPLVPDLWAAVASAERVAKKPDAALAAARKAVALGEKGPGWGRLSRMLLLAETLAFAGQPDEAKKTLDVAVKMAPSEPTALVRASALLLSLKDVPAAVDHARRAVAATEGGDARAHAALGDALSASGDAKGAAEAWARAAELDPENAAVRRKLDALRGGRPAKPAPAKAAPARPA
jgi:tetratricopeptide (TPR) repeat protein